MALPSNVGKGTVTGRFIDSTGEPIEGSVTFTPSAKRLLNATAEPSPVTILPQPVTVELVDGSFTAELVATDDPDNNPSGWTYAVKFGFRSVTAAGFDIEVPEDSTVDLTTVAPVSSGNGTTIIQGRGVPSWDDATDGQVIVLVDGEPAWGTVEGGGGGGADLTSYSQVSGLADYPAAFPPDLSGVTPASIGAQSAGDYLTEGDLPDLSGYATTSALSSGLAGKADTSELFSGDYDDLTNKPTIPSAPDLSSYATKAELFSGSYNDLDDKPTIPAPPDLSGYAEKSDLFSGAYGDLTGTPTIPSTPQDIGAQPAGDYLTEGDLPTPPDLTGYATKAELFSGDYGDLTNTPTIPEAPDLSGYATRDELFSGSYTDLDDKPDIPSTPGDIGAQPEGSYATAAQGARADTAVQPAMIADMVTGDGIAQIVALTQAAYDNLTPDPATLYVITDA